jgi:heme exporter protein D
LEHVVSFLEMGGYGAYVWPAFAATALVLVVLLWATVHSLRANERMLAGLQQAAAGTDEPRRGARSRSSRRAPEDPRPEVARET